MIASLKVTLIALLRAMFFALFLGSVLVTLGGVPTVNLLVFATVGLPARSVTAPARMVRVYSDSASLLLGLMVNTFPLILFLNAIFLPLLFFSSTLNLLPFLMASLKVTLIVLLGETLTAPFLGSTLVTLGEVPTLNLLVFAATGFPARSVTAPL